MSLSATHLTDDQCQSMLAFLRADAYQGLPEHAGKCGLTATMILNDPRLCGWVVGGIPPAGKASTKTNGHLHMTPSTAKSAAAFLFDDPTAAPDGGQALTWSLQRHMPWQVMCLSLHPQWVQAGLAAHQQKSSPQNLHYLVGLFQYEFPQIPPASLDLFLQHPITAPILAKLNKNHWWSYLNEPSGSPGHEALSLLIRHGALTYKNIEDGLEWALNKGAVRLFATLGQQGIQDRTWEHLLNMEWATDYICDDGETSINMLLEHTKHLSINMQDMWRKLWSEEYRHWKRAGEMNDQGALTTLQKIMGALTQLGHVTVQQSVDAMVMIMRGPALKEFVQRYLTADQRIEALDRLHQQWDAVEPHHQQAVLVAFEPEILLRESGGQHNPMRAKKLM